MGHKNKFFEGVQYLLNERTGVAWAWTKELAKLKHMIPYHPPVSALVPRSRMNSPIQGLGEQAETEASLQSELTELLTKLERFQDKTTGQINVLAQKLPAEETAGIGLKPRPEADQGPIPKEEKEEGLSKDDMIAALEAELSAPKAETPKEPVKDEDPSTVIPPVQKTPEEIQAEIDAFGNAGGGTTPPVVYEQPSDEEFIAEFNHMILKDFKAYIDSTPRERIVQSSKVVRSKIAEKWARLVKPMTKEDQFPYELGLKQG